MLTHEVLAESGFARSMILVQRSNEQALDALCKAKALVMATWRGTGIATTHQVAEYYGVGYEAIAKAYQRNEEEFAQEVKKLTGKELREVKDKLSISSSAASMLIWTPRGTLRIGLMLNQSEVARSVRDVVLNVVEVVQPTVNTQPLPNTALHLLAKGFEEIGNSHLRLEAQIQSSAQDVVRNTRDIVGDAAIEQTEHLKKVEAKLLKAIARSSKPTTTRRTKTSRKKRSNEAYNISLHLTEEEGEILKEKLKKHGLTGAQLLKQLVTDWMRTA